MRRWVFRMNHSRRVAWCDSPWMVQRRRRFGC